MKTLAERITYAREKKGTLWNKKHLAAVAGLSYSNINMLEKGERGAKVTIPGSVPKVAKALGVNYEWLAYGTGAMMEDEQAPAGTHDDDLSGLRTVYLAIQPEFRTEALRVATQAMISFLSPHTSS